MYVWRLGVGDITDFLQQVHPYLVLKKRQAEIVLEFIGNTRKANQWSPLTEKEKDDKTDLYIEISVLNAKGTDF